MTVGEGARREPRRDCVLCGKKANGIAYPYGDAQAVWDGNEEPIFEYYLCDHHADNIAASSVNRMLRRRISICGGGKG
jgi:hypothetical protein